MKRVTIPFLITAAIICVVFVLFQDIEHYFTKMLESLTTHSTDYAIMSFFVMASDIILPVPSSIVMYTNGYVLGIWGGAAVSFAGLMTGTIAGYYIGRFSSITIHSKSKASADNMLLQFGSTAILISRAIPIVSESISIVCGYNKMPLQQYITMNILGYIPLCFLYSICGNLGYTKNTFLLSFSISILISAIFWIVGKKLTKQTELGNNES